MKIWRVEEQCDHPPLALAVVSVWMPARWRASKTVSWIAHGDEAMRGLFPNLPETIEGPWGSLARAEVFGPEEACSAMLDAMEGLSLMEGGKIDPLLELGRFTMAREPFAERVSSGKLSLSASLQAQQFSMGCEVALLKIEPDDSFFKGDKQECLRKIDRLIDAIDVNLRHWIPTLTRLADPAFMTEHELGSCLSEAKRMEISRATPMSKKRSGRTHSI